MNPLKYTLKNIVYEGRGSNSAIKFKEEMKNKCRSKV